MMGWVGVLYWADRSGAYEAGKCAFVIIGAPQPAAYPESRHDA
jgi:hypothetical protein